MGRVSRAGSLIAAFAIVALVGAQAPPAREVAITFDDLPVVHAHGLAADRALTTRLLATIRAHKIPAIGFVNEGKLGGVPARRALLRQWIDAGLELGNHSFSHWDLNEIELDRFEADVLKGDAAIRSLLAAKGAKPRYFRHPFLHTGRSLETRQAFETFLSDHGYRVAPVTVDNDEYIFAVAYDRASTRGDRALMQRIAAAYVPYMDAKFDFFERNSREMFGREMRQILLVHANLLNADHFDGVARAIATRGYTFITLDRALEDPAFQSLDTYVGPAGITWIHRWALTKGMPKQFYANEPIVPAFVADAGKP